MNAWIVTWHCLHEWHRKGVGNLIAAVLPGRTRPADVAKLVGLLYANYIATSSLPEKLYVSEQVRFARKKQLYKPQCNGFGFITCHHNPYPILLGRRAFDLKEHEIQGHEMLTWEEECPADVDPTRDMGSQIGELLPLKRKKMKFCARTNSMSQIGV